VVKGAAKLPLEIVDKEVSFDFKGAIQEGQDFLHSVTKPMIQAIENSGAPAPLVAAATLPLHVADSVVNFDAGAMKGAVSIVEGIGGMAAHPVDTVTGLAALGARSLEGTPQGRTALFLKDLATGKFQTQDEALKAMRESQDPFLMAKANYELGRDVLTGVFADAIKLAKEGKYDEAAGTVVGQFADVFVGLGITKLGAVGKAGQALNQASRVERTLEAAAQTARTVDKTEDLAKAAGGLRRVTTRGRRGEAPLTAAQRADALSYARELGMPEPGIIFSESMNTGYKMLFGEDLLYIGTDVLPGVGPGLTANSRISMRGALAHEMVGHRAAELAGRSHTIAVLEEAQASIRAARFAPALSMTERFTLLRDAIERLRSAGYRIKEVRNQLWIGTP
jgi:hypothetical protein